MSGSCGCENSNCKCAESYSAESKSSNDDMLKRIQKRLTDAGYKGKKSSSMVGPSFVYYGKVNDRIKSPLDSWSYIYYYFKITPIGLQLEFSQTEDFKNWLNSIYSESLKYKIYDELFDTEIIKQDYGSNPGDIYRGALDFDELGEGIVHINDFWKPKTKSCSHDNLGIKTMEQLNGELLLTLVCDACGKRTSTSAPIESDAWDAESFSASVVNKSKVPQGAIAKAMMNRAMITQVSIESVIQELENKVNLGIISEDELMKSLKKKFGAEYDIQVFNSRYGYDHIECGKCGGSHSGYCPDYGEEDEYTKCTDCKWDGANGNWNTVIEWCSSCKEENERYWKENAERIRLEKEREEQEERDFQDSEKYSREMADIWEDRYLAESKSSNDDMEIKPYMKALPFPDNRNETFETYADAGWYDESLDGKYAELGLFLGSGGSNQYEDEGILEWWVAGEIEFTGGDFTDITFKPKHEKNITYILKELLDYYEVPEYEIIWRNRYDEDESDVFITLKPLPADEEKLWKSLWENKSRKTGSCSHDDFEIETIEKDGSDYLLTFKCLDCKKVGSTSAELQDNEWMS
jgi:hypothetical protein